MRTCEKCQGAILEANVTYGWGGRVCYCDTKYTQPSAEKDVLVNQIHKERMKSSEEIDRLKRELDLAKLEIKTLVTYINEKQGKWHE